MAVDRPEQKFDLPTRLRAQRDKMESVWILRQVRPGETDGMYYSANHSALLKEAADEIERLQQRIAVNTDLARRVIGYDRERDYRATRIDGKFIGGSDVCATCEAHCIVMDENENIGKVIHE